MYPDAKDPNIPANEHIRNQQAVAEIDRIISAIRSSEINDHDAYFNAIMPLVAMIPEQNKSKFKKDVMELMNKYLEKSKKLSQKLPEHRNTEE